MFNKYHIVTLVDYYFQYVYVVYKRPSWWSSSIGMQVPKPSMFYNREEAEERIKELNVKNT